MNGALTFNDIDIATFALSFVVPAFRVLGMFMVAPVLSNAALPMSYRIVMGFAVALAAAPVPVTKEIDWADLYTWTGVSFAISETFVGILMGAVIRLTFACVEAAGEIIGNQMGLQFAASYDASMGAQQIVTTRLMIWMATGFFVAINGHGIVIATVIKSFSAIPVGAAFSSVGIISKLLPLGGQVFSFGLLLSLPILIPLICVNLVMGVLSKAAPQLNLFSVGFQVTLIVGLVSFFFYGGSFASGFENLFLRSFDVMGELIIPKPGPRLPLN